VANSGLRKLCAVTFSLACLAIALPNMRMKVGALSKMADLNATVLSTSVEKDLCPLNEKYRNAFMEQYEKRGAQMKEKLRAIRESWWNNKDGKIYVQHIHKAGGTTLCAFFKRKTDLPMERRNNCNGPRESHFIIATNFTNVEKHMNRLQHKVVFNERDMASIASEEDLEVRRKNFILITTIREPVDRIISHMAHVYEKAIKNHKADGPSELGEWLRKFTDGVNETDLSREKPEYHHHEHNFQALNLLGRFGFQETSKIPVSTKNALKQLDEFDVVIPTDEMDTGLAVLNKILWPEANNTPVRANARKSSSILAEGIANGRFIELYREIIAENCIDVALYERAKMIFSLMLLSI